MFFGPSMRNIDYYFIWMLGRQHSTWFYFLFPFFFYSEFIWFFFCIIIYSFILGFSFQYGCLLPLDRLQDSNSIIVVAFFLACRSYSWCMRSNNRNLSSIYIFGKCPEMSIRCKKNKLVTAAWGNYNVAKHECIIHSQTVMQGNGGCMFNHHFSSSIWNSMFYIHVWVFGFFCWLITYLYTHNTEHWAQGNRCATRKIH